MINFFETLFEARERKFQQEKLFRGESVDLVARITTDGVLDQLSDYQISGVYQPTDNLSGPFYPMDAEIVDGKAILHWTGDNDFGKNGYNVWGLLTKDGKAAYPVCWRLNMAHSPSYPLSSVDPIPRTIDFSQYDLLNAPWLPLSGGNLSGRIYYDIEEPVQITNLSSWIGDATGLGRGIITIYNETQNTLDDKYSQEDATLSGRWDNMWNPPNPTGPLVFPENPSEGDVFEPYAAMDGEYLNGKDVTFSKGTVLIANPGWETKEVPCFYIHVVYTYIYHNGEGWVPRSENDWCICKIDGEWQAASFSNGFTAYDSLVWHEFSEGGTEPKGPDPFVLSSELGNFATKKYVQEAIASIPTPEVGDFATYEYVNQKFETKVDADATRLELDSKIAAKVSKDELNAELSNYATNSFVNDSFNNARTYTDEQIDWLSNVYTKTEILTATYETQQHAADTYHTKADAVADSTYLTQQINGVRDSLSDYCQISDDYATEQYVQDYVAQHGGGSTGEISACLSSLEFENIEPLSGDTTSYALSTYIAKLNEVIYALKRYTPPEPPTPVEPETTRFFYTDNTSADIDIVGVVSDRAYKSNNQINRIEFGTHCTGTGFESFQSCTQLSAIQFSSTMTEIGHDSFNTCTSLKELVVPGNVLTVGQGSFRGDTSLRTAVFEEGVKQTNASVFYGDTSLSSITLPSTLLNISNEFAYNCQNLVNLIIPANSQLTSIGDYSFALCRNCNSFTIPASVTSIGNNAFSSNFGVYSGANLTFAGKTMAQVQAMTNYPWGARSGMQFICTDGTITR